MGTLTQSCTVVIGVSFSSSRKETLGLSLKGQKRGIPQYLSQDPLVNPTQPSSLRNKKEMISLRSLGIWSQGCLGQEFRGCPQNSLPVGADFSRFGPILGQALALWPLALWPLALWQLR